MTVTTLGLLLLVACIYAFGLWITLAAYGLGIGAVMALCMRAPLDPNEDWDV